ncbi:alpha-2B adrenergic receptor [Amia ocellicauda]|uniref:alpha-2B adrenergic receptor n=1 Tax=Amia ocellicauda TaxID=2972642 RepID=UPI003463E409
MDDADVIQLIVRAVMCLLGIMGNHVLAFRSLPRTLSRLKTPEALFLNLAASNLITNYLVDLPETLADIAGDWFLGDTYCGISNFCSDLSETSSILATVFISIFWYQKLVGALKRGNAPVKLESLCLACVLVVASWCIAIVFSVPHLFYFAMGKENSNETGRDCKDRFPSSSSKLTYEVMYLTAANAVPIALMVFVNLQIVVTLLTQRNRIEEARGSGRGVDRVGDAEAEAVSHSSIEHPTCTSTSYQINSSHLNKAGCGESESFSSCLGRTEIKNQQESDSATPKQSLPENQALGEKAVHFQTITTQLDLPGASVRVTKPDNSHNPLSPNSFDMDTPLQKAAADRNPARPTKTSQNPGPQVRAAKSVVAVATVFLICWVTHLSMRIANFVNESPLNVKIISYVGASYTCVIPYIFLYGVKKLSCQCRK